MTRRDWLRRLAAAGAAGVVPGSDLAPALAAAMGDHAAWLREALPASPAEPRRLRAYDLRVKAAFAAASARLPRRDGNTDETRVPAFLAMFSKGLPHDAFGLVDPEAYRALARAAAGGPDARFEDVPLGGTRRLVSPQAAFAFALDGLDAAMLEAPAPPAWESAAFATEAIETYWMALLRDVPFARTATTLGGARRRRPHAGRPRGHAADTCSPDSRLPTPDSRVPVPMPAPGPCGVPVPPARRPDGRATPVAARPGAGGGRVVPRHLGRVAGVAERAVCHRARRPTRAVATSAAAATSRPGRARTTRGRPACRLRSCSRRCARR